jgi:hypothetical protein
LGHTCGNILHWSEWLTCTDDGRKRRNEERIGYERESGKRERRREKKREERKRGRRRKKTGGNGHQNFSLTLSLSPPLSLSLCRLPFITQKRCTVSDTKDETRRRRGNKRERRWEVRARARGK